MPRRLGLILAAALSAVSAGAAPIAGTPVTFADLPGFSDDDLAAALRTFRVSCAAAKPMRPASAAPPALKGACDAARRLRATSDKAVVRAFFERHFEPRRVPGEAFFTGYYEPVVAGSLGPSDRFAAPVYARPEGLVTVAAGKTPGLDPDLIAARRLPDGQLVAMPDRAAIEGGALGREARPIAYLESPVDAFFVQVQGSARIRLPDGRLRRLVYDGRNGFPYTSIGKVLVERLGIPPSEMGMSQLRAWIRDNGQRPGEAGARLMQENRSFVFFRFDDTLPSHAGPIGGEGVSLTPLRSLAIDRKQWAYGLPFYVDTVLPDATPFRSLMVAQDTGSAIVGVARGDIFFGSGDAAARAAGPVRQPGTLYVLWPKDSRRR